MLVLVLVMGRQAPTLMLTPPRTVHPRLMVRPRRRQWSMMPPPGLVVAAVCVNSVSNVNPAHLECHASNAPCVRLTQPVRRRRPLLLALVLEPLASPPALALQVVQPLKLPRFLQT